MTARRTEALHAEAEGLDALPPLRIAEILARAQVQAARTVENALPAIAEAAELAAGKLQAGGRLVYAAAGSSGLMALADALELPGTFGIARERVVVLLAGGTAALEDLAGGPEDDRDLAASEIAAKGISAADCVIAVSASGSTPYAVAALEEARRRGATAIAIANNEGAALFEGADVAVLLPTPPEVIAGSTRMGAGTAQKIALNMLSTLIAVHLGHVHDGYMINLRADNAKLRDRAARIVAAVAGCDEEQAARGLERAGGAVKPAVLIAAGARDRKAAEELLEESGQSIRSALALMGNDRIASQTGA